MALELCFEALFLPQLQTMKSAKLNILNGGRVLIKEFVGRKNPNKMKLGSHLLGTGE